MPGYAHRCEICNWQGQSWSEIEKHLCDGNVYRQTCAEIRALTAEEEDERLYWESQQDEWEKEWRKKHGR